MSKHKVARKVANMSSHDNEPTRITLGKWLKEAYPEVFKQYEAIRDLEDSVVVDGHHELHQAYLKMLELENSKIINHKQFMARLLNSLGVEK